MKKLVIWSLFDSGNGSYKKVADELEHIENYSIGLDIEKKNSHFINLNLADYSYLFGDDVMIKTLEKLPKPDLIIASPPCESWSVASAMKDGNASWKQERGDSLFEPQVPLSRFTIRGYKDFEGHAYSFENKIVNRINGELTIYNTVKIINHFKPKYYIIENPAFGRIWDYIEDILGFKIPYDNLCYYSDYGFPIMKPTKFKSNLNLNFKTKKTEGTIKWENHVKDYNGRSLIPEKLVFEIFEKVYKNCLYEEEKV